MDSNECSEMSQLLALVCLKTKIAWDPLALGAQTKVGFFKFAVLYLGNGER